MNEEYILGLLTLTRTTSEAVVNATIDHLCKGDTQTLAAQNHQVQQEAIARLAKRIRKLDKQIENIYKLKS